MAEPPGAAIQSLNQAFMARHPHRAALWLERLPPEESAKLLNDQPTATTAAVWGHLSSDIAEVVLLALPARTRSALIAAADPVRGSAILRRLEPETLATILDDLSAGSARELRALLGYNPEMAGALMDPLFIQLRATDTVSVALERIRAQRRRARRALVYCDAAGRPLGLVTLEALALSQPDEILSRIGAPLDSVVRDIAPRSEVAEKLDSHMTTLPVVDFEGRLIGVVRSEGLVEAIRQETGINAQTMVGAGREERTLSPVSLAVKKRLPWLEINLLTAFLAASVVGIFESTIAAYSALAVLLPVVAGQSGNAGAQALAVTMRGLAVREVSVRMWPRVMVKEVVAGLINGLAVGLTTGIAVLIWSGSWALAAVITSAMVLAMVAAGFSGALIPMILVRFGLDPAQSSSIILTTVTDVVGFFAFLGIATAFSGYL